MKLRVYGSRISYYTGKLECYLRYRGIAYQLLPTEPHARAIRAGVGTVQMPVVELPAPSDYDPAGRAPFNRAINVFGRGVPR